MREVVKQQILFWPNLTTAQCSIGSCYNSRLRQTLTRKDQVMIFDAVSETTKPYVIYKILILTNTRIMHFIRKNKP